MNTDPELLAFTTRVIEQFGGVTERQDDRLLSVLPQELAQLLDLPEELQLGGDDTPILYGSPILDRFIHAMTQDVPLLFGHIEVPYLKKAGFEQQIDRDFVFSNARIHVSGRAEARTTYMQMLCRFLALSDERKEGIVEVGVQENSGAVIENFQHAWRQQPVEFYQPGQIPPHFPIHVERAVSNAMRYVQHHVEHQYLTEFITSMKRRLRRDVGNTKEYYEALQKEMEAGLSHPNLSESHKQDRLEKIRDLPDEMERKIADLKQKYTIRTTLSACAVIRLLVDVVKVMIEIRHKKFHKELHLIWNPVTGRFDPLVCERCHDTSREIYFRTEKSGIELVCLSCSQEKRKS
ncbi:MAG: hypothetical protein GY801_39885 [bacterium]|nr:hypothetical protein [bacterium]